MEFLGKTSVKTLLWTLSVTFVALLSVIIFQNLIPRHLILPSIITAGTLLLICGIWLIILTAKKKIQGNLRKFLILTGVCAAGIIISILLHNLIYGLFIYWFGADFWTKLGTTDEFVFFILAIIICPIGLIIGIIGSSVQLAKAAD